MKVVILAPVYNSLLSMIVTTRCIREPGVSVEGIIVRKAFQLGRIFGELRRDGSFLIRKIWSKIILGEHTASKEKQYPTLASTSVEEGITAGSLKELAREHNFPLLSVKTHNDDKAVDFVRQAEADLVVFTGGGLIRKPMLTASRYGVLNAHFGMLPEYRGLDLYEWVMLHDQYDGSNIGVTLHVMDSGVDTGPIITSKQVTLLPEDSFEDLNERSRVVACDLLLEGVRRFKDGTVQLRQQKKPEGKQYFYMPARLRTIAEQKLRAHLPRQP